MGWGIFENDSVKSDSMDRSDINYSCSIYCIVSPDKGGVIINRIRLELIYGMYGFAQWGGEFSKMLV